jgi:hypothetical protein
MTEDSGVQCTGVQCTSRLSGPTLSGRTKTETKRCLALLDASLQIITCVEVTGDVPEHPDGDYVCEPICDVAVHGDQVIVLASSSHAEGSGLRLLDLDGRFLRTIAAGLFIALHHRRQSWGQLRTGGPFVVDDGVDAHERTFDVVDEAVDYNVLHLIDIQSGDILQSARLRLSCEGESLQCLWTATRSILRADRDADDISVLRLAGSET